MKPASLALLIRNSMGILPQIYAADEEWELRVTKSLDPNQLVLLQKLAEAKSWRVGFRVVPSVGNFVYLVPEDEGG